MKNILLLPMIYIATASFISFKIIAGLLIKPSRKWLNKDIAKYQRSFYFSRQ